MTLDHHSNARPSASETPRPALIISHAEMNEADDAGLVQPLGRTVAYAVKYQGAWWVHFERGWIRADETTSHLLEEEAARIQGQDAVIARGAAFNPETSANSGQSAS